MIPGADETLRRRLLFCSVLLLPTLLIFAALTWNGVAFCCDANAYLSVMKGYRADGLFHAHGTIGYRAYLFPYFYSLIPFANGDVVFADIRGYTIASIGVFLLVELAVLTRWIGSRLFWPTYVGFFLNPLLLVYVPYPMGESFVTMAFVGVIPGLLALDPRSGSWRLPALLGFFFGVMYMTRPSNVTLALPVGILLVGHLRALPGARERIRSCAAFGLLVGLLVAPQSAISLRFNDTVSPYPRTAAMSAQLLYGKAFAKYGTNVSGRLNTEPPMAYWNPLNCESNSASNARSGRLFACLLESEVRREGPAALAFTGLIHVYNALNYDVLRPYVAAVQLPLFSLFQMLSMAVVFLGSYAAVRKLFLRTAELRDWFLFATAGVTLGVAAVTTVETRFGLLATASFSLLAAELLIEGRMQAREWLPVGFGLTLFLLVSSLLSVYVLAFSGGVSP